MYQTWSCCRSRKYTLLLFFSPSQRAAEEKNVEHEQTAASEFYCFRIMVAHNDRRMIFIFQFYKSSFMRVICPNIDHL